MGPENGLLGYNARLKNRSEFTESSAPDADVAFTEPTQQIGQSDVDMPAADDDRSVRASTSADKKQAGQTSELGPKKIGKAPGKAVDKKAAMKARLQQAKAGPSQASPAVQRGGEPVAIKDKVCSSRSSHGQ